MRARSRLPPNRPSQPAAGDCYARPACPPVDDVRSTRARRRAAPDFWAQRDVRIRIQAAGVSFATSLVVQGRYQRKPPLPFTPGTEVAGIIIETGAKATRFKIGERVCAVLDWGGLAEEAVAREVNVFAIPDTLSFTRAIAFTNSYATSAAALTWSHLLHVQAGETLAGARRKWWCRHRRGRDWQDTRRDGHRHRRLAGQTRARPRPRRRPRHQLSRAGFSRAGVGA